MSLGVAFKGTEGIVLAVDSRVTLSVERRINGTVTALPATFDNATKLLHIESQPFVGAVTYGLGALGGDRPRTAHSFLPELDAELRRNGVGRLSVQAFAEKLSAFFMRQWEALGMPPPEAFNQPGMTFLVGGYDPDEAYGRVFEVEVPHSLTPKERSVDDFGVAWGGQGETAYSLISGFNPRLPYEVLRRNEAIPDLAQVMQDVTDDEERERIIGEVRGEINDLRDDLQDLFAPNILYQFLPLQDCIDLAIFLIEATSKFQSWQVSARGVGGHIDVATVTRVQGFQYLQRKELEGNTR